MMFFSFDSQQPSDHFLTATEQNVKTLMGDLFSVLLLGQNQSAPPKENLSYFLTNKWIP